MVFLQFNTIIAVRASQHLANKGLLLYLLMATMATAHSVRSQHAWVLIINLTLGDTHV